jgi:hypothetical protein
VIEAVRAVLRQIFASMFGSEAGHFGYPIANPPSLAMVVIGVVVLAMVLVAVRFSVARVRSQEPLVIGGWLILAFAAHLALAQLAYAPLHVVVESEPANGFYAVSKRYSAPELMARYHEIVYTFPTHVRANLPGKILLYEAMELATRSTQVMAYSIILLSNLGGVLAYSLAKQWFQDSLTAFYALVLYLFMPARIFFFPLLNTISPLFLLLGFWIVTRYLESRRKGDLLFAGVALYAMTIFDPLLLVALPVMAALVVKQIRDGKLTWTAAFSMAAWIAASFAAVYAVVRFASGFDLIGAFRFAFEDARAFNLRSDRPYSVWVVHNLKDFFLNMGLAQSVILAMFAVFIVRGVASGRNFALQTEAVLTLALLAVLFGLDLAGVNRGEAVRLWIFLGVLMQILVARALAVWNARRLFVPVLSFSVLQTALCLRIVAWIIP